MNAEPKNFIIKTVTGYYYTTGRGRYGRFSASRAQADLVTRATAERIVAALNATDSEMEPEILEIKRG